jgi:hypothetical protein
MCFITLPKPPITRLLAAAQNMQALMDNGTFTAALGDGNPEQVNLAISAFDRLAESVTALQGEIKEVSPFLRYRREIMEGVECVFLKPLVLCLWNGRHCNLSQLFISADGLTTRIALECITSYSRHGENDQHFMTLALEIVDEMLEREASEVAA